MALVVFEKDETSLAVVLVRKGPARLCGVSHKLFVSSASLPTPRESTREMPLERDFLLTVMCKETVGTATLGVVPAGKHCIQALAR